MTEKQNHLLHFESLVIALYPTKARPQEIVFFLVYPFSVVVAGVAVAVAVAIIIVVNKFLNCVVVTDAVVFPVANVLLLFILLLLLLLLYCQIHIYHPSLHFLEQLFCAKMLLQLSLETLGNPTFAFMMAQITADTFTADCVAKPCKQMHNSNQNK